VISVFIVAASPTARASLENLLVPHRLEIAGSVANFDDLEDRIDDAPVDAILVDSTGAHLEPFLEMINASGLASDFSMVLLAEPAALASASSALRYGVRAVLPNDISPDQLATALQAAASGLLVLHPAHLPAQVTTNGFASAPARSRELTELAEPLTPRESEVLQMLASGFGNKEIAVKLSISEHTVKFHVASILGKLGAGSRTEAVSLGIRRGLVLL